MQHQTWQPVDTTRKTTSVGIDIGSESTKVVLGPTFDCEIVRNEVGEHTTSTGVTFTSAQRLIGHAANTKNGNKNTVIHLNRLLPDAMNTEDDLFRNFYCFDLQKEQQEDNFATVEYNGGTSKFNSSALLAMLLTNIKKNIDKTIQNRQSLLTSDDDNNKKPPKQNDVCYVLSLPPGSTKEAYDALYDAAYAAGLTMGSEGIDDGKSGSFTSSVKIVNSAECTALAYRRKFPPAYAEEEKKDDNKNLMVIDMGHTQTSVSILRLIDNDEETDNKDDAKKKEEDKKKKESNDFKLLSSVCNKCLGGGTVDVRLWEYFTSNLPSLQTISSDKNGKTSKRGQRLLVGCQKLKHLLSQLPEASVTVENVGDNDTDVTLTGKRDSLLELCKSDKEALTDLINQAMKEANLSNNQIDIVEVLGGGCRIPWVQTTIFDTIQTEGGQNTRTISRSLDDTSVALGAALLGTNDDPNKKQNGKRASKGEEEKKNEDDVDQELLYNVSDNVDDTDQKRQQQQQQQQQEQKQKRRRIQLLEAEQAMAALDLEMFKKDEIRNKIESHILEMRKAKHNDNKYGSLLPDSSTILDPHLNEIDDWLFSDDADKASLSEMETKLQSTIDKTNDLCSDYFTAIQKDEETKNQQMEEEAKLAQAERDAASGGEGDDNDDHDNRRLPKKRRMEIVMKNKNEANELFSDKNYRHAAARYTKALTHCAKFVDLNPDDIKEVNAVKLSLNLNLALSYIKLENYDQALRVCNEALAIDGYSAKALYRRATIYYEKKQWDKSLKDVQKAMEISPEDKAIPKLQTKIDYQIKKQKLKEKKMAQKMFG